MMFLKCFALWICHPICCWELGIESEEWKWLAKTIQYKMKLIKKKKTATMGYVLYADCGCDIRQRRVRPALIVCVQLS